MSDPPSGSDDDRRADGEAQSGGGGGSSGDEQPPGPADEPLEELVETEGLDRRTLIRLLIAGAIGIPLLVEGLTFLGIVGEQFGDHEGTPTATPTEDPGVTVGDDLLPSTPQSETVEQAHVASDGWTFTMVVAVENGGDRPYELRLGAVSTEDGRTVEGGGTSGSIAPGEGGTAAGSWDLPDGVMPAAVDVVAVAGDETVVDESVPLGNVNVRG